MHQLLVPVLVWGGSVATFAATRAMPAAEVWAERAAALATLVAIGATVLLALRRGPWLLRQQPDRVLLVLSVPALLLIALSGGFESPAALLPAFFVMSVSARHGLRAGAGAAVAAALALVATEILAGAAIDPARALSIVALTAGAGLVPFWFARRADREVATARQRLARVEGYMADRRHTPATSAAVVGDLRSDAKVARQDAEGLHEMESLDRYLRDVRDATGADEVIFWKWSRIRGTQLPAAWSTEDADAPLYFSYEQWAPLVKWAAEGEMPQCVEAEGVAYFAAGPVKGRARLHGVLTISASAGLTLSPSGTREWLARYAVQVALLTELLEIKQKHGRDRRHSEALLGAAEQFRAGTTPTELGKAICAAAMAATSAKRSVLVRWYADERRGVVQASAGTTGIPENMPVLALSFVGERCMEGLPVVQGDARTLAGGPPIMNSMESSRVIGSLAVVPMKLDDRVVGAILIESDTPGDVTAAEGKNLGLLGALAANFLEAAWNLERAVEYSRTDRLTGLWNRGHFDEQLVRVLKETDRFGPPSSLVVADVDFFKKVNDEYGHEAGDAVLKMVAKTFLGEARTVDICARYGGEEIAILLPHTPLQGALELAERLRKTLHGRLLYHGGRQIGVTASFGVASYPETVGTHEGLFPAADRALYQAKKEGRNRVKSAALYPGGKSI